jgi:hypothetical protein
MRYRLWQNQPYSATGGQRVCLDPLRRNNSSSLKEQFCLIVICISCCISLSTIVFINPNLLYVITASRPSITTRKSPR